MIEIRDKYVFGDLLGTVSDDGIIYVKHQSIGRIILRNPDRPYIDYRGTLLSCPYTGSSVLRGGDYIAHFDKEGHLYLGVPMAPDCLQDWECIIKADTEMGIVGALLFYSFIGEFLFGDLSDVVYVYDHIPYVASLIYLGIAILYRLIKGKGTGNFAKGLFTGLTIYIGVGIVMMIFGMVFLSQFGRHEIFGSLSTGQEWTIMLATMVATGLVEKTKR